MRILGIDIGTTTISASVWEDGCEASSLTVSNDSFLAADVPGAAIQDPARILETALDVVAQFPDVDAIAPTGQMHGIVYVDHANQAVSPLYTWQDQRSADTVEGMSRLCGYPLSAGYGLATHVYLMRTGGIPANTVRLMTIMDYLALRLCGQCEMHASTAASLGLFDIERGLFDAEALLRLGIDPAFLPPVTKTSRPIGKTPAGQYVFTAIGDNQASYMGAMEEHGVLLNLGTGGQISVYTPDYRQCPPCETRPLDGDACLMVGSLLCGGRAYAILENFFRQCCQLSGTADKSLYPAMNRLAEEELSDLPHFSPLFAGSRENPAARAFVEGLTEQNFTPAHLIQGLLQGIAHEMYSYYSPLGLGNPGYMAGSGNGIRKNPALQKILSECFGAPLVLSRVQEEAAFGAARLASRKMKGV